MPIRNGAALVAARKILGEEAPVSKVIWATHIITSACVADELAQDQFRKLKQKELRELSAEHRKHKQQGDLTELRK